MKAALIDGYIDEPAALGVPPYISQRVRAIAGIFYSRGIDVDYFTIDTIREKGLWDSFDTYDYLVLHGGLTTPGHYTGGTPASLSEFEKLLLLNDNPTKIVEGPIVAGYSLKGGRKAREISLEKADALLRNELDLADFLGIDINSRGYYELMNEFYKLGAGILPQHPGYPNIIVEFDISSGCERRDNFCSFCTESLLYGNFKSRDLAGIVDELKALKAVGAKAIRFGRSANVTAYGYDREKDQPDPEAVELLFQSTSAILNPEVFHIDNGNPIFIARHRKHSEKIIESIVKYNTVGDTISFGVESFDPVVRRLNNIDGTTDEIIEAIKIVNEIGNVRIDGIPKLLPGINLLYGLPGTTKETFEIDFSLLKEILERDLIIRRLNIRQVMVFGNTPLSKLELPKMNRSAFERYKKNVRNTIDKEMIQKVFPIGAIIRRVIPEFKRGALTFGRPLGTYPILVGSYAPFDEPMDMVVIAHGARSVTGIPLKSNLNSMDMKLLESIPGIGRHRATNILLHRPFVSWEDVKRLLGEDICTLLKKIGVVI
ncbi:radical SAM protein [Kosmotoga arenicorallina S304]|uniref:Radical SAM protein n=1 Tax=Kosmotoga arenicorallina S304 TaxID=1453497 RepID=A0A176K0A5_9BACT|nr:radical SAM protein [Kosmotoga arenicorallina]OAA30063.1 radical SAM protein [Kosmotoga arenicorallina S304]